MAHAPLAVLRTREKCGSFEFLEQVGFFAKVAEMVIALRGCFSHGAVHLKPVVAMEGIPFEINGFHPLAAEYLLERVGAPTWFLRRMSL